MIDQKSFLKIISNVLKEDVRNINLDSKIIDFAKWDSLTTINILLDLKKKYNLKVDFSINHFKNLKELYEKINKKNKR